MGGARPWLHPRLGRRKLATDARLCKRCQSAAPPCVIAARLAWRAKHAFCAHRPETAAAHMLSNGRKARGRPENSALSKVAIIGSCITRDLWPILGVEPSDLLYISRTSLPSLFSAPLGPIEIAGEPPSPLRPNQHRAVVADLTKNALAALVIHQPSHIIFDFIDERFDLLAVGEGLATHSWELEVSGYLSQPALSGRRTVPRLSAACDLLWRDALGELAVFLAATPLADAQLILHEAQWAERALAGSGRWANLPDELALMAGHMASRARQNLLLDRYQTAFRRQLPQAAAVRASPDLRVADPNHRWGLSPFHYVEGYYRDIWRQLQALGV
jgi:hypothetical protein